MTTGNTPKPTKNERRQQAREQAKEARELQRKKEQRNRVLVQGGIIVGLIAVATIVTLVIVQSVRPAGPGPLNFASDGVVFTQGEKVMPTEALDATAEPIPTVVNRDKLPVDISIYVDYMCPYCGYFEQTNQAVLNDLLASGEATVEVHPITALDSQSLGTNYSTRAANALGCVVNFTPDAAWKFHSSLLSAGVQPAEGTEGLSNDKLIEVAKTANGDKASASVADCIETETFSSFMNAASDRALTSPPANLASDTKLDRINGTPTVLVNGVQYLPPNVPAGASWQSPWQDPTAFSDFVYKVIADVKANAAG